MSQFLKIGIQSFIKGKKIHHPNGKKNIELVEIVVAA